MSIRTLAPRTTAAMLRKADASRRGVVVRYLDTDVVAPLSELTDVLADDPDIDVLVTSHQLTWWLSRAGGDYATAARLINASLRELHELELAAEARLAVAA
jgi:hypothetical protein